jgi:hypothetical protein
MSPKAIHERQPRDLSGSCHICVPHDDPDRAVRCANRDCPVRDISSELRSEPADEDWPPRCEACGVQYDDPDASICVDNPFCPTQRPDYKPERRSFVRKADKAALGTRDTRRLQARQATMRLRAPGVLASPAKGRPAKSRFLPDDYPAPVRHVAEVGWA